MKNAAGFEFELLRADEHPRSGAMWHHYKVTPAVRYEDYDANYKRVLLTTKYIMVSAVVAPYTGPETFIFPADIHGNVTNWGELHGSYTGGLDHARAIANLEHAEED